MPHLPILRCLFLLLVLTPALKAQSFLDWKALKPGPHAVGFKALAASDATRTFQTPTDYFGHPRPGFGNRPVQIALWYPAEAASSGVPLTYGDYVSLLAWELGDVKAGAEERLAAESQFVQMAAPSATTEVKTAFGALFRESVRAKRDAKPAAGRFSVMIYAPGGGYPAFDNSVLAEFLASHGFIVLSSPSVGPEGRDMPASAVALDAESRDMEFLAGYAQSLPQADPNRIAAMGFSLGGPSAALFTLRNARVKALISLDGALRDERYAAMAGSFPQFRPDSLRVPLLWIACAPANSLPGFGEGSFQEQAKYSDLVKAVFPGLEHHDFSSMSSLQRRRAQGTAMDWSSATASYEASCRIILGFLESRLNGIALKLDQEPEALCKVTFRPARKAPPSSADFREILLKDGLPKASELVQIIQREYPEALPAFEAPMTAAGYEVLGGGRANIAVGIFALMVETYPDSFNASDSLGEAYLAEGSLGPAERCYAAARSKLENDPRVPADRRAEQRARIDKVLADIRARKGKIGNPAH